MSAPTISIGMPVFNCETTVADSIASILNQSYKDWELVVYDDGSRDRTMEVARRFSDPRIRIIDGQENRGLPSCLNRIIESCGSKYFARMDGDDIAYPRRLEEQVSALEQNPEIDILGSSILILDEAGEANGLRRARETHKAICGPPWSIAIMPHVTWMGRTEWFKSHPYDEIATHAQDRDLLIRSRRHAKYGALQSVLMGVREVIVWRKQKIARMQLLRTAFVQGLRQHDPSLFFLTTAAEFLKCGIDFIATFTGLNHRLLRYRVPPVDAASVAEWQSVLSETRATVAKYSL